MIPGYNAKRPEKSDYEKFERNFTEGLEKINITKLSLMIYGSYLRGNYIQGRSDIDSVLIFPNDVITNKEQLFACSKTLETSLSANYVPLQICVCDIATMQDGRFNSFSGDFEDYFRRERKILLGPDYFNQMTFIEEQSAMITKLAFNLRKSRTGLLFSEYHKKHEPETLIKNFGKGIDSALNSTKHIGYLTDKKIRENKFSSFKFIKEQYPNVNLNTLELIEYIYKNPQELDSYYKNPGYMINLWSNALTTFEEILKEYIKQNPIQEIPILTEIILK